MSRARTSRVVLAVLTLSVVSAAPAAALPGIHPSSSAATAGGLGLRLLDAPVSERTDPRARLYIIDRLAPGTVIHRRIEVSNTTGAAMHVALYSAAATIAKGTFLGSAGHTPNLLSSWTSVSPGATTIPAGGSLTGTVTVAVPRNAAPGEQYGVVWAEVRTTPTSGTVTEVSRVGIRLYVSVGPGGAPASNFTIKSLTAERSPTGAPLVVATVANTGGRALDMSGALKLTGGPGGLSAGPFQASLGTTLAIGDTEPVTVALDKQVPAGPWDAQITLRSGLLSHTARATITFPKVGAAAPVPTTTKATGRLIQLIVGLGLLLLVGLALLVTRRRVV